MIESFTEDGGDGSAADVLDNIALRTREVELGAQRMARAMTSAFASSAAGGKQFDDILKSLALRLSNMALRLAFRPLEQSLASGFQQLFSSLFSVGSATPSVTAAFGAVKPFATGGVINAPSYFPLTGGGVGLAGEAGPEAIMPLRRGADGRLGVASAGGGATHVTINIATPDAESFRRSETYVTGQIARAVLRGRRSL
jgi:lambda family phage tail tape measure protein